MFYRRDDTANTNCANSTNYCNTGYFCPPGTNLETGNILNCSDGYYCPKKVDDYESFESLACPMGRYCVDATAVVNTLNAKPTE